MLMLFAATLPVINHKSPNQKTIWSKWRLGARQSFSPSVLSMMFGFDKKTAGLLGVCGAAMLTVLLTWNFWVVGDPLAEGTGDRDSPLVVSSHDVIFEVNSGGFVRLKPRKPLQKTAEIRIILDDAEIIDTIASFTLKAGSNHEIFIPLHSKKVAGHCVMSFQSPSKELENIFKIKIQVKVVHHILFGYLTVLLGWGYFVLWGITYYPQLMKNWQRRSVAGFSFDYLALNMTGHLCFLVFNLSMFYNHFIQREYHHIHPKGETPVKKHDTYFSIHAVILNLVLIGQCCVFDRGDQKMSLPMSTLVCGLWVTMGSGLFAAICEKVSWLHYIYYLSYIKVSTTPIKYFPQVYLHYIRQSTDGWAVQSVFCDMLAGILCFLQMITDAFNNDDWDGTIGNPGKLGLSLISIVFNAIFLFQHYILYPKPSRKRHDTNTELDRAFKQKLESRLQDMVIKAPPTTYKTKATQRIQEL